jgi:hypothetical protein
MTGKTIDLTHISFYSIRDGKLDPGSFSIPIISRFGEENLVLCRVINGEKSLNLTFLLLDGNLP